MVDDGFDIVIGGLPRQDAPDHLRIRDDGRRVARPSGADGHREVDARNPLDRVDNFSNRITASVTTIQRCAGAAATQIIERIDVSIPQIADVNVIADTCPVWRRIVRAEYLHAAANADG